MSSRRKEQAIHSRGPTPSWWKSVSGNARLTTLLILTLKPSRRYRRETALSAIERKVFSSTVE
jgi:hypothetical protein